MHPSKWANPPYKPGAGAAPEPGAPRSWIAGLARELWPFWLFKDASRGDLFARAAAMAHNRRMAQVLPRYLRRWLLVCGVACLSIFASDSLATDVGRRLDVFVVMAAGAGLVCTYAICVILLLGYAWCYLRLGQQR